MISLQVVLAECWTHAGICFRFHHFTNAAWLVYCRNISYNNASAFEVPASSSTFTMTELWVGNKKHACALFCIGRERNPLPTAHVSIFRPHATSSRIITVLSLHFGLLFAAQLLVLAFNCNFLSWFHLFLRFFQVSLFRHLLVYPSALLLRWIWRSRKRRCALIGNQMYSAAASIWFSSMRE